MSWSTNVNKILDDIKHNRVAITDVQHSVFALQQVEAIFRHITVFELKTNESFKTRLKKDEYINSVYHLLEKINIPKKFLQSQQNYAAVYAFFLLLYLKKSDKISEVVLNWVYNNSHLTNQFYKDRFLYKAMLYYYFCQKRNRDAAWDNVIFIMQRIELTHNEVLDIADHNTTLFQTYATYNESPDLRVLKDYYYKLNWWDILSSEHSFIAKRKATTEQIKSLINEHSIDAFVRYYPQYVEDNVLLRYIEAVDLVNLCNSKLLHNKPDLHAAIEKKLHLSFNCVPKDDYYVVNVLPYIARKK